MSIHLSARARLTLVYTSLFAVGGAALVLTTYLLVAHSLEGTATVGTPKSSQAPFGARSTRGFETRG